MKPDLSRFDNLPRFPDGRIDFTHSPYALGVHAVAYFEQELLLLKRSDKVSSAKNEWLFGGGYVDEDLSIEEKGLMELAEETGITQEYVGRICTGETIVVQGTKTWEIFVVFVELTHKPEIILDWEHTEYTWATLSEAEKLLTLPGARRTLKQIKEVLEDK